MSIQVNDFQWEPGKNDAEYIKLLESSRDEWQKIAQKAIVKLKALSKVQEPKVMTLEEVQVSVNPVWLEGGIAGGTWGMMPKVLGTIIEFVANGVYTLYPGFVIDEYGKTWRCWTSRPTDKQRESEPWK